MKATKKSVIMSFSTVPEVQLFIKSSAKKMGLSISALINNLVNDFIPVINNDAETISITADAETKKTLNECAAKLGCSNSELVKKLVKKYAPLTANGVEIPVIIKVPVELKGNSEGLKTFFNQKTEAIVNHLTTVSIP